MLIKKQEAQKLNDLPKGRELLNRRTTVQTHIPDSKACTLSTIRWKLDYQRLGSMLQTRSGKSPVPKKTKTKNNPSLDVLGD